MMMEAPAPSDDCHEEEIVPLHSRNGGNSEFDELESRSLHLSAKRTEIRESRVQSRQIFSLVLLSICALITIYREEMAAVFFNEHNMGGKVEHHSSVWNKAEPEGGGNNVDILNGADDDDNTDDDSEDDDKPVPIGDGADGADDDDDDDTADDTSEKNDTADDKQQDKKSEPSSSSSSTLSVQELKDKLQSSKKEYETNTLDELYGEYKSDVFDRDIVLDHVTSPSDLSSERLKRRIKIKIIEAQLHSKDMENNKNNPVTFTWVVGGHSAAAGHGNLFEQSFGAILESALQPIFQSIGIQFYGKNYAMGNTRSGPQTAMCMEAIYGSSIDALSWDFSMTDGRYNWYYDLWSNRAGVHPTRPILFSFGHYDRHYPIHERLDKNSGMGTFLINLEPRLNLPNTDQVKDVTKLPSGVKNYICSDHVESGEPCKNDKWKTSHECKYVRAQTSWHNGWKDHLFMGHFVANFMIEMITDAIDELSDSSSPSSRVLLDGGSLPHIPTHYNVRRKEEENTKPISHEVGQRAISEGTSVQPSITKEYLAYLKDQEEVDKQTFLASPIPQNYNQMKDIGSENYNHLHRSSALCRTSILPAQSRFDGLVTGSNKVSEYLFAGKTAYKDEGENIQFMPKPRKEGGGEKDDEVDANPIWLAYENSFRMACPKGQIDTTDTFLVRKEDGWMSMTIPNKSETEAYVVKKEDKPALGLVMICTRKGEWGNFPDEYVQVPELTNETEDVNLTVNGVDVVSSTNIDDSDQICHVLKNADGYNFPSRPSQNNSGGEGDDGGDDGGDAEYEIKIRVPRKDGKLFISYVVVL